MAPASQTYAAAAHALLRELQAAGQVDAEADIARRRLYDARDAAWRDLEGWIFGKSAGDSLSDRGDRFLLRGQARIAAENAVAQWRERPQRVPTTSLEQLLERVAAAEDAIGALKQSGVPSTGRERGGRSPRRPGDLVEISSTR